MSFIVHENVNQNYQLPVPILCQADNLLNKKGLKFLTRYYQQFNFIDNLIRLISYLGRTGDMDLLLKTKNELEVANLLILNDDEIELKIARAINEAILAFEADEFEKKMELISLNKELAKIHSFKLEFQIKYIESLNFSLLDLALFDKAILRIILDELLEFIQIYNNNQEIHEKASIGLLWASAIFKLYKDSTILNRIKDILFDLQNRYPQSNFLSQIISFYKILN